MENYKPELRKGKVSDNETNIQESLGRFSAGNPYIVLGVTETATAKEIVSAWKKLMLEYHPDKSNHPQAKEIAQYLNRAIRKLVSKDGTLLKYNPENDTEINDDEDIEEWDFGFPNVSDEEWYAGDKYWEYQKNIREKDRGVRNDLNQEELKLEKDFVLSLFNDPRYDENSPENNDPKFDPTKKYIYQNSLIKPDLEEETFQIVGSRYTQDNGVVKNLIDFNQREKAWKFKKRIYNSDGKIVFDGGSEEDPLHLSWEELEAPPFLYHGTIDNSIEEFTPRSADNRPTEKPAVYASPDKEIAVQSMANKFVSNGGIVNHRKFVCIPMTKEEFLKQDKGGIIYALPGESFKPNHGKGFGGDKEWISTEPVKPKDKIKIPSLLESLIKQGTEVYFIDPTMIPIITEAQDTSTEKLEEVLAGLKPETL